MAKNKAINLHDHLFEQLERLNDTSLKGADLDQEIRRASAMNNVAGMIIQNGKLVIDAIKMAEDCGIEVLPDMLSNDIGGLKNVPKQLTFNKK